MGTAWADVRTLEAFHMTCQHQILGICWYDYIFRTMMLPHTLVFLSSWTTLQIAGAHFLPSISPVCLRLYWQTKPCAAMSTHHCVGHHSPHGDIDQVAHATVGWSKSVKTLDLLQQTCGTRQSNVDIEWCCSPGWLRVDDDDDVKTGWQLMQWICWTFDITNVHVGLSLLKSQWTFFLFIVFSCTLSDCSRLCLIFSARFRWRRRKDCKYCTWEVWSNW